MKRCLIVLLSATLAGCASSTSLPVKSTEESLESFLVGTWNGYVVRNNWVNTVHPDITLQIFEARKNQNVWTVNATLNDEWPEYIELYVHEDTIELRIMNNYGGLIRLTPYKRTHLIGGLAYGRGRWTPLKLSLEKVSR